MSAGNPEANPITDLLLSGLHPFPADMENLIQRIAALDISALDNLDNQPAKWAKGKDIEQGMATLKQILEQAQKAADSDDDLKSFGEAFG